MNQPAPLLLAFMAALLPATAAEPVSFSRDVLPILSDNCFGCHGQDESHRKGKLRLDLRDVALAKEAFVPGKPEISELINRIVSTDEDELMPPPKSHKARLTAAQTDILRRWIAEGAVWGKHWAFELPVKASVQGHPVDGFVGKKLATEGLTLAKEAPKHTLLRRLSFDLTGLPPTEAETKAFLADTSPQAYEKAIDRLLASPHYGERMAMWCSMLRVMRIPMDSSPTPLAPTGHGATGSSNRSTVIFLTTSSPSSSSRAISCRMPRPSRSSRPASNATT
ncbi:MAG: hypothetical protein RJB43_144 [Verrucomicrobiota bacterium]|jgi:hypothetical protein